MPGLSLVNVVSSAIALKNCICGEAASPGGLLTPEGAGNE